MSTKLMNAVAELLKIPCERHQSSIPTCPECGSPVAVWEEMQRLRAELATYRASVTTGGPPAPFTERWVRGPSSRPSTAPPEEVTVALPVSDEGLGEMRYSNCEDCGKPHPAWISCEDEARIP